MQRTLIGGPMDGATVDCDKPKFRIPVVSLRCEHTPDKIPWPSTPDFGAAEYRLGDDGNYHFDEDD